MCTVNDWVVVVQAGESDVIKPVLTIGFYTLAVGGIFLVLAHCKPRNLSIGTLTKCLIDTLDFLETVNK